jgi:hypothetical protein
VHNPQSPHDLFATPGGSPAGAVSGNTSGMGARSDIPPEIRGWNWGAFLLNLFWGIGNNTWIALLMLVPFLNWVMPFFLGALGNTWAWQNRRWDSVAHFRRVQRRWAIAGLILWLIVIGLPLAGGALVYRAAMHNPIQDLAFTAVRTSPEAATLLGTPISKAQDDALGLDQSWSEGSFQTSFIVSGPRGSGTVQARARLTQNGWELVRVAVLPAGGGPPLVVLPRQRL